MVNEAALPGAPHCDPQYLGNWVYYSILYLQQQTDVSPAPSAKNLECCIPGTDYSSSWKHTQAEDLQMFNETCEQPTKFPAQSWEEHTSSSVGSGSAVREGNKNHSCSRYPCHKGCPGTQAHLLRIATFQSITVCFWNSEFSLHH